MSIDPLDKLRRALPSQCTVERTLTPGGQGVTLLGTYRGDRAVLKMFSPYQHPKRILREIDALSKIKCPHLVRLIGYDTIRLDNEEMTLLAYEFYEGGDLRQLLPASSEPVANRMLARIGSQMGCAIELLWENRIVHRDIKPANIVRASEGRFVLVDIGFAKYLDLSKITTGGHPGTLGYMSPEQASGQELTIHSDIFSLGLTLYEIAAKKHPFDGRQELIGVMNPKPLAYHRSDLEPRISNFVDLMIANRVYDRPPRVCDRFNELMED